MLTFIDSAQQLAAAEYFHVEQFSLQAIPLVAEASFITVFSHHINETDHEYWEYNE